MPELGLFEYYQNMCKRNIILDFQGAISQDILVGLAELLKSKFSLVSGHSPVKKLFSIFIEMAQNIAFYSSERIYSENHHKDIGVGIVMVTEKSKCYTVISGNMVQRSTISKIQDHCMKINGMTPDELKQFYKERIKLSRKVGEKGAGIGLIDIARKSGSPIQYNIIPIDDFNSFLILSVKVKENGNHE
ncbi:MAG: SiaB family protein kinase [Candidatus Omnitrophota bacterium]